MSRESVRGGRSSEHPVFAFGSRMADAVAELSPILATFAGVAGHDHLWDDLGPSGLKGKASRYDALDRELRALENDNEGDASVALALRVLREHIDERRAFFASDDPYFDLNHISSSFQMLSMVFDVMPTTTVTGAEAIAERLQTMPAAIESYRALLAEGRSRGAVVAARQVESVIRQGREKARSAQLSALATRAGEQSGASPALSAQLIESAKRAEAATSELVEWLETAYLPHARIEDAVGRARYERAATRHLGMSIDLDETHRWGFSEIARIETEVAALVLELAPTLGVEPDVRAVADALDADPVAAPELEAFLEAMRARQAEAMASLDAHFDVPPPARALEVRLSPPGGPVGAYYMQPSEDFARPGTVWYSPGSATCMPLWREVTTAFHEGFPGHHLQIATQVFHRDRLTRFQRVFSECSGYAEGWALYAEQLMLELGLFRTPAEVLGMHLGQLVRACRVVVDIGLHLELTIPKEATFHPGERWSHALALELLDERALLPREKAESELVRYLGWPGQAITYRVGQREMLRLRARRRQAEGERFDLRRFHADVLATGNVGLATLDWALSG